MLYCRNFNKYLDCHSGILQRAATNCSDTEYSLLLNSTNREVRTIIFNLLNETSEGVGTPSQCQDTLQCK